MADPSQNIHQDLLPHIHLLSTYRYPVKTRIELQEVTKYLLAAPKIARDTAPFFWTYLDCPQDGTIVLTWQPTQRRQLQFSSDGFVWNGPEVIYQHDAGHGLILEMYLTRSGYQLGEQFAMHSRRRFRLTPQQIPAGNMPNMPQVDPNLWIVHYGPSEKNDAMPVTMIPPNSQVQGILNFRQHLFQMGQIVRKEFMLSDRVNWPSIPLPGRTQPMYAPPPQSRGVPQTMAYPPQAPNGGHPRRRAPPGQPAPGHAPMMGTAATFENAYDDDEDTTRGDIFDHLTAREVSMQRFQQNHEWMEEILSSPYRLGQIVVPDLGLGLKGELAPLTQGVFQAQSTDALTKSPENPYTGRLNPNLAREFRERMEKNTAALSAEVAEMKAKHSEMISKFKGNATIKYAEHELRQSVQETGSEFWRLEGRHEEGEDGEIRPHPKHHKTVEEIVSQVEASIGRSIAVVKDVQRIAEGGFQEPAPEPEPEPVPVPEPQQTHADPSAAPTQNSEMSRQPSHAGSQQSGVVIGDSDMEGGTAAGMLDQMHSGFSSTSTPLNSFPTPQPQLSAAQSAAATPVNISAPSPQPTQAATGQASTQVASEDVEMADADASKTATMAPDQGTGSGEWVVVPKGGVEPAGLVSSEAGEALTAQAPSASTPAALSQPAVTPRPPSAAPTPGLGFDANDFNDLNTAGDELAGYDPPSIEVGDLDMESDFANTFHGIDQSGDSAHTPADPSI